MFQAWISANSAGRTLLVRLAILVDLAFVRSTTLARLTLESIRTEANLRMIRDSTQRALSARVPNLARILAFFVDARLRVGTVVVRFAASHASAVLAQVTLSTEHLRGTLHPAFSFVAGFPANAVGVGRARFGAVARLVAVAFAVATKSRLAAGY